MTLFERSHERKTILLIEKMGRIFGTFCYVLFVASLPALRATLRQPLRKIFQIYSHNQMYQPNMEMYQPLIFLLVPFNQVLIQ